MEATTFAQLIRRAMRQAGLQREDLEDFGQDLRWYINEGYSILLRETWHAWHEESARARGGKVRFDQLAFRPTQVLAAWTGGMPVSVRLDKRKRCLRLAQVESGRRVRLRYRYLPRALEHPEDVPRLPPWSHGALADWATWRVYMQGNPQRQQRGLAYRQAFEEVKRRLRPAELSALGLDKFRGLYLD